MIKKEEILTNRILRCNKAGKIITITVNKVKTPCNCTKTKITEWKTDLKEAKKEKEEAKVIVQVATRKIEIIKLEDRVKVCKKTGQVIIQKKVCTCNKKKIDRWVNIVREDKREIAQIKLEVAQKDKLKTIKTITKIQELKLQCINKNSEVRTPEGKVIGCKQIIEQIKINKVHINVVNTELKKVVLQDRILRCNKTGKIITITVNQIKRPCECTKPKVTEWKKEVTVLQKKQTALIVKEQEIVHKVAEKKIEVLRNGYKLCTKTNKWIIIEKKKCPCSAVKRQIVQNTKILIVSDKKEIAAVHKQIVVSVITFDKKCEKTGQIIIVKNPSKPCNCKKLNKDIIVL